MLRARSESFAFDSSPGMPYAWVCPRSAGDDARTAAGTLKDIERRLGWQSSPGNSAASRKPSVAYGFPDGHYLVDQKAISAGRTPGRVLEGREPDMPELSGEE